MANDPTAGYAHQGVLLGERQQGTRSKRGRMVHSPYQLREFIKLYRDHGAHFLERPSEAHPKRLEFQKTVLSHNQEAEGTNFNYSVTLLEKLGWHWYKDVEIDLMNLFDPTA